VAAPVKRDGHSGYSRVYGTNVRAEVFLDVVSPVTNTATEKFTRAGIGVYWKRFGSFL
jgi:hypothetical protein